MLGDFNYNLIANLLKYQQISVASFSTTIPTYICRPDFVKRQLLRTFAFSSIPFFRLAKKNLPASCRTDNCLYIVKINYSKNSKICFIKQWKSNIRCTWRTYWRQNASTIFILSETMISQLHCVSKSSTSSYINNFVYSELIFKNFYTDTFCRQFATTMLFKFNCRSCCCVADIIQSTCLKHNTNKSSLLR